MDVLLLFSIGNLITDLSRGAYTKLTSIFGKSKPKVRASPKKPVAPVTRGSAAQRSSASRPSDSSRPHMEVDTSAVEPSVSNSSSADAEQYMDELMSR